MRIIQTEADIQEAIEHLGRIDPRLRPAIALAGPIPLRRHRPGFVGLCKIIISQQLSVASADAIWSKTEAGLGTVEPAAILATDDAALRRCGLSGSKIRTLRAIAEAVASGALPIDDLHAMPIPDATAALVSVKGIGPWTAEIYLMFYAGHADVFASGDLALQEAAKLAFGLENRPSAKALSALAEAWSPWRAVAARLLWAYYRVAKSREGVTG
ncbi:MAG: DNA-3-methyladenine glycosylase [Proteobacteria bacterium]|nr:DNA-3-methyladenine glycosylase [Pseudomonadota bacterium]